MPVGSMKARLTAPIDFPEAVTFRPTMEEFRDFSGYIRHIESTGAHHAGICKIIPPDEWVPRKEGYDVNSFKFEIETPIKQQFSQVGRSGAYQTKGMTRPKMTVKEYYEMATGYQYQPPLANTYEEVERKYWKQLTFGNPIYGADVAASITDPEVQECNIAKLDSILKYLHEDAGQVFDGVNSPYLYFGMWKATFSWHVEDMDLYGINFLHHGLPKTWYCVPPKYGYLMERAARKLFPDVSENCSNFMRHKTCLISPTVLDELGVPYQRVVQEERNIIIVFPYAYHSGFNHGFNIAESTNFALERWIEYGKRHRPCDCPGKKVKLNMNVFVKRFQPDLYESWMAGTDIAPHPEDPQDVAEKINQRAKDPKAYAKMMSERLQQQGNKEKEEKFYFHAKNGNGRRFLVDMNTLELRKEVAMTDEEKTEFDLWKKERLKAERVDVDVYQHIDLKHIKASVYRDTMIFYGLDELDRVREQLGRDDLNSIQELVDVGEMIKVDEKIYWIEDDAPQPFLESSGDQELEGDVYVHVLEDIKVLVDSNHQVIGEAPEELRKMLEKTSMTKLIAAGIFVRPEKRNESLRKSLVKEEDAQFKEYQHRDSGDKFILDPVNFQLIGRLTKEQEKLFKNRQVRELIESGELELVEGKSKSRIPRLDETAFKTFEVVEEDIDAVDVALSSKRVVYMFKLTNSPVKDLFITNDYKDLVQERKLQEKIPLKMELEQKKFLHTALCHSLQKVRVTRFEFVERPGVFVSIRKDNGLPLDEDRIKLRGKSYHHYLARGLLRDPTQTKALLNTDQLMRNLFGSLNRPAESIRVDYENSRGHIVIEDRVASKCIVIKDEITAVSVKAEKGVVASAAKARAKRRYNYSSDEEDDEDGEESDAASDISSDNDYSSDPDYFGSGPRFGGTRKRRRLDGGRRAERRGTRERIATLDQRKLKDKCRQILSAMNKKSKEMGEDSKLFLPLDLLQDEVTKTTLTPILVIFKGLKIVQSLKTEMDTGESYLWSGLQMETLTRTLLEVMNDDFGQVDDPQWKTYATILKAFVCNSLQLESASFLDLYLRCQGNTDVVTYGEFLCKANEATQVFSSLHLIKRSEKSANSFHYYGPNVYPLWLEEQLRRYADEDVVLRPCYVSVERQRRKRGPRGVGIKQMYVNSLTERTNRILPLIEAYRRSGAVLTEDQERSLRNSDRVCSCGYSQSRPSEGREKVHTGYKRRMWCKNCPGCKIPKCGECLTCTNPQKKKACLMRECYFPIMPKCPCFVD